MKPELLVALLLFALVLAPLWALPGIAALVTASRRILAYIARLKTGRRFQIPTFNKELDAIRTRWESVWNSPWGSKIGNTIMLVILVASVIGLVRSDKPSAHPADFNEAIRQHNETIRQRAQASNKPTAMCRDNTYSYSQTRAGTCSYHGGVKEWLP